MSRRKRQPEQFDVVEFLRDSDDDLKSALNSLLRSPSSISDEGHPLDIPGPDPGVNLTPGLVLVASAANKSVTGGNSIKETEQGEDILAGINSGPGINITAEANLIPPIELEISRFQNDSINEREYVNLGPDPNITPAINLTPGVNLSPDPNLIPAQERQPQKRQFPIREMKLAQDAHTRAEQQVYEYLWQNAKPIDEVSRIITMGFGAMSRMVRLSESNARINVRSLIAKLAIQEFGDYNCERSLGRTYRILNYSEILKKRREAGLLWYMRRTLAVVFVDPTTAQPINLGIKKLGQKHSGPGPKLSEAARLNLDPASGSNLNGIPGLNLRPLYREEYREKDIRNTSSSDSLLFEALNQYGVVDNDVLKRLRYETKRICPDFTDQELVHFIHSKGDLIRRRENTISSPIGFLLTSVPKCFAGEPFELFRKQQRETNEREAADRVLRKAELENWQREQENILADPNSSEDDKNWARKMLYPTPSS